jgi:dolichyl-phosphate beta-glucosyltransferase
MDPLNTIFLSIVIPVYNEEDRISDCIARVSAYAPNLPGACEIIIVDDGSDDGTGEQVRRISSEMGGIRYLKSDRNRGKGHAVRKGMRASQGQFSLISDVDLSTPISELEKFLPRMTGPEKILIGNRKVPRARIIRHQTRFRESLGKVFTLAANVILGMNQRDFTCGFKVFGAAARELIFGIQKINGWAYDAEILFLARKFGFRIEDIPVVWENSNTSSVKLLSASIASFLALLKIRWNDSLNKYRTNQAKE